MRIESKNNVIVTGFLFAKSDFLKNIKDYYKGEIFVNSKEEHNFFNKILNNINTFPTNTQV